VAITAALFYIAFLMRTIQISKDVLRVHRIANVVARTTGRLVVPMGFFRLNTIPLLFVLILLILTSVISGFWLWIKMFRVSEEVLT
jgi:cytochrome b subunit of formate dehydrogenase